ncbi:OmpA family protein [Actibacterium sp. XHP0104]|uniref:OmpA family protein n=1 Tax=Actibacterium sp. XHP0104 TaxID=2984335 RepID=UPI0021E8B3F4|nr:OmpA family protein [Actibacterium sp. XHP0104]MCV2883009.1 OmpA family protein [Actibacterium sp. XHP0104]
MRLTPKNMIALAAMAIAALLSVGSAFLAASAIEKRSVAAINTALAREGITWVDLRGDGLKVHLTGTAPTEAQRFRVVTISGTVIDANRVIDTMEVTPSKPVDAPDFSVELLRNDAGISMIGLIPANGQRGEITAAIRNMAGEDRITDMLTVADYPVPENWDAALKFGLEALRRLPRSKISVTADSVTITAVSDSRAQKRQLESELNRARPTAITAKIDISAPRPVITPFTLRFVIDEDGARFDACSADTDKGATAILAAAQQAGAPQDATCTVGLGAPTPRWTRAATAGITALAELGGGSLSISDADLTLIARQGTEQDLFDKVVGQLDKTLPEVFSLHAVLPEPPAQTDGTTPDLPEFVATRSPEGQVDLNGVVPDELTRAATESYAHSRFGLSNIATGLRQDDTLPDGWPMRVLTGLEGLAEVNYGSVTVRADFIELRGMTGDPEAKARIARLFGLKLGDAQNFNIQVTYLPSLAPENQQAQIDPQQCVDRVNAILNEQQIMFEPGSARIDGPSREILDQIADVLRDCPDAEMEIGGHTDSQGREEMNQTLSQQRADAVLNALLARRILTSNLTARGYGEVAPIAENDTEEGREANRRIEFRIAPPILKMQSEQNAQDETAPQEDSSNEPN